MPKAYVIGALIPRGGAFMAYHIGLLLHREFGYELVNVQAHSHDTAHQFDYDVVPPTVTVAQMERSITDDDVLVINPSFSRFMFGLRLPGRKICYVQDFRTFGVLDCHFDLYVSVSTTVQDFLRDIYGMHTTVIPPFVQWGRLPGVQPWRSRPAGSVLMYVKDGEENHFAAQWLQREMQARLPAIVPEICKHTGYTHRDLMVRIGAARYLVNVSLAEGFGLVPVEAMALGTCVTGLDGVAGKDYMRFGVNSMTCGFKDIARIPLILEQLLQDEAMAEMIAVQGAHDARRFTYDAFYRAWTDTLRAFLEQA